jgi:hypothetical protein
MGGKIMSTYNIVAICAQFKLQGEFLKSEPYGDGHINDTFKVVYNQEDMTVNYIIQRVNHHIFKEPENLMENIEKVTKYLEDIVKFEEVPEGYEVLKLIETEDGKSFYKDEEGNYFRAYVFVVDATGHTFAEDNSMLTSAGEAFGQFQKLLRDYPVETLHETIVGFHHSAKRYETFLQTVEADPMDRKKNCEEEINFVMERQEILSMLVNALENKEIPYRVTHNDTKINNVLLDDETLRGRCVIDLDTVMPGSALYDFGDAIRSCGSTVEEDSEDLDALELDMARFEAYTKGYLSAIGDALTEKEIDMLPYGAIIMTLECGMRFLTDYIDGDNYFKVHKEGHNLIRCRNQFAFVKAMESKMDEMKAVVKGALCQF